MYTIIIVVTFTLTSTKPPILQLLRPADLAVNSQYSGH